MAEEGTLQEVPSDLESITQIANSELWTEGRNMSEQVRPPTFREIKGGLYDGFGYHLSPDRIIRFAEGEGWNIVTTNPNTGEVVKEETHLTEEVADAEIRLHIARRRQKSARRPSQGGEP